MNLLTKKTPWVAASLLAAASVFAQQSGRQQQQQRMFDQGHELSQSQMMAAYSAPARIEVRGAWDFYAQGSFTYWQASEENLELGIVNDTTLSQFSNGMNGNVVNMDFDFKPGFKVGLGMNFNEDNWDGLVQYTWFRGTNSVRTTLDQNNTNITLLPMQLHPLDGAVNYFSGRGNWRLHMDLLDVELGRSEYRGTKLTFRPFIGARAAWIRQKSVNSYTTNTSDNIIRTSTQNTNSWALGPRFGVATNWMIGQGFRFYGNGSGDVLFTRYTTLRYSEEETTIAGVATGTTDVANRQKKVGYLRPHVDFELGIGWGTYFDNNNWHVDLSAGYNFQVFFSQNMFRNFTDGTVNGASNGISHGDLYVQGLTATVRFDF